ncbi:hypothetical protein BGW42_005184 [Actinomortierella wolfii]|nr:hypothetical protein BGW42_005184 [Actinomortierella wolfii]
MESEDGGVDHDADQRLLSSLEQSMSSWVLPRLNRFHVTVYQQSPRRPPFLIEIKERLEKKRPALDVQICTNTMHVQRRVRLEEHARLRLTLPDEENTVRVAQTLSHIPMNIVVGIKDYEFIAKLDNIEFDDKFTPTTTTPIR